MATVYVDSESIGPKWPTACRKAAAQLNQLFKQNSIGVALDFAGKGGPRISVRTDPSITGTFHGHTHAETISGQLQERGGEAPGQSDDPARRGASARAVPAR